MYPYFAVIALGSNLANPAEQVRAALAELAAHPHIRLEKNIFPVSDCAGRL